LPLTDGVPLLVPKREGEKWRIEKSKRDPTMIRIARFGVRLKPLAASVCQDRILPSSALLSIFTRTEGSSSHLRHFLVSKMN